MHNEGTVTAAGGGVTDDHVAVPGGVSVVIEDDRWNDIAGLEDALRSAAAHALNATGSTLDTASVGIALLDDVAVRALNRAYRRKDAPTNVLSFAPPAGMPYGDGGTRFLGDIALAFETVLRESEEAGVAVLDHAIHLIVHGVLHLCGLDHGSARSAKAMEDAERLILAEIGVADPYPAEQSTPPEALLSAVNG